MRGLSRQRVRVNRRSSRAPMLHRRCAPAHAEGRARQGVGEKKAEWRLPSCWLRNRRASTPLPDKILLQTGYCALVALPWYLCYSFYTLLPSFCSLFCPALLLPLHRRSSNRAAIMVLVLNAPDAISAYITRVLFLFHCPKPGLGEVRRASQLQWSVESCKIEIEH